MLSTVVMKDNSQDWLKARETELSDALGRMAQAVLDAALIKAPKSADGGDLRESGKVSGEGLERTITFGEGLKYADYQERGERRDGSRKVKHYTTAGTSKHYLKDSGDAVVKKGIKEYL